MKRTLVKQGNGALTITLPFKWITKNNLQKGDELDLLQTGRDLIVSSKKEMVSKDYEIYASKEKPFFKRYLKSCYILGYDKIKIFSDAALPIDTINEALSDLIGYEIIEQSSKRCVISMIASTLGEESFEIIMRRLFFMTSSMFDDIITALEEGNYDELPAISKTETSINRLAHFSLRFLTKRGYTDFHKTPYVYLILNGLEQIGDGLRDFCKVAKSNALLSTIKELKSYYNDFSKLFYSYDMKLIKKVKEKRLRLYAVFSKEAKSHLLEIVHLYYILSLLHQLEIALDPINN